MKKKFIAICNLIFFVVSLLMLSCCSPSNNVKASIIQQSATQIVIKIDQAEENVTLLKGMEYLKQQGLLSYTLEGTMVKSINSKTASDRDRTFWALYTSASEMSNTAWGSIEVDGQTCGSAILGADSLMVKAGELYIWKWSSY